MKWMPTCKETTALASRAMDERLPLSSRMALRLHLAICENCARFNRQLQENTSLCVRWDADCHQAPEDDDGSDWSVSLRFCWQSDNGSNQARRSKLIHREKP
jgi:hypothetical protein